MNLAVLTAAATVVVTLAARGASGQTTHQDGSSSQRMKRAAEDTTEVQWSASCSPRISLLRHYQDAVLECGIYAPGGTVLVWFKDDKQIFPQVPASTQRHTPPQGTVSRRTRRKGVPLVHFSASTYIDCASSFHQGRYSLRVTTPSQHVHVRNFTVILTSGVVSPALTCFLSKTLVAQIPRIWLYARHAQGRRGGRVLLPCRVELDAATTITTWYFKGQRLDSRPGNYKYQVLASGDLLVRKLEPRDAGLYTCAVSNAGKPFLLDRVHTWLITRQGRAASP